MRPGGSSLAATVARADAVSEWADTATEIATDGPNTVRTMALIQNAVYEAVNAITGRYPADHVDLGPTRRARRSMRQSPRRAGRTAARGARR